MKISIITVSYNSVGTIEETIKSVISQQGVDLEYIVIDGGSTDGTLGVIDKYRDRITSVVSEADEGIYDAMNKGILMAKGHVIGLLNSDDTYSDSFVLFKVIDKFKSDKIDCCYGDIVCVNKDNTQQVTRYWKSGEFSSRLRLIGWYPPHPAFFSTKDMYDNFGRFNTGYKIAADADLMFRFIFKHKAKVEYIPEVLVRMKNGGVSDGGVGSIVRQNIEIIESIKNLEIGSSIFMFLLYKIFSRISQFLNIRRVS